MKFSQKLTVKNSVFQDETACDLVENYQNFEGICTLLPSGQMEYEDSRLSRRLVNLYQTT
jgi:hypothetical protein